MTINTKQKVLTLTEEKNSPLEKAVRNLPIQVNSAFIKNDQLVPAKFIESDESVYTKDSEEVAKYFPKSIKAHKNKLLTAISGDNNVIGKKVGVLFSGGPAAGGHNVIVGLKKILGNNNTLLGIKSGPKGLLESDFFEITDDHLKNIYNTGGFDFLGTDRTKIKSDEQFEKVKEACKKNNIDALVIIGGDDSNTNAGILAEKLFENIHDDGRGVQVIGVPKTIDGDLQIDKLLPISFGFDSATKIYAQMVGNILQDTPSSRKYWHFVKLMGRSASHVTLEVALQTKPALTLISEEVAEKKISLTEIVNNIASIVIERAHRGMNYGVVLVPEGLIEFIPGMTELITTLNDIITIAMSNKLYLGYLENNDFQKKKEFIYSELSGHLVELIDSLPDYIQEMLLAERDSHGNLQVSLIPTEQLLIDMVAKRVKEIDENVKFNTHSHFFGYEGRCGVPTKFDMTYTLNLGMTAGSLILDGRTGYIASVSELDNGGKPLALPLTGLFNIERRHGEDEIVIEKALVELDSEAFKYFALRRNNWALEDRFSSPGPIQLWGPVANRIPKTVFINKGIHYSRIYRIGTEINLFPDLLIQKAKDFLEKYDLRINLDSDAYRITSEDGTEGFIIKLPKTITVNSVEHKEGMEIYFNEFGEIFRYIPK